MKLLPINFYLNDKKNFQKNMRLFLSNFKKYNIDLVKLNSDTVDRADIIKLLLNSPYKFIIYSGYQEKSLNQKTYKK